MRQKLRLAPVLAIAALAAAGCGGSSATTAKQLVAQADPICKQVSEARSTANAAVSKANGSKSKQLATLARVTPGVATDEHQAITRLRALKVPSSMSKDWQQLLTGMQQLANDATQIGVDAKAHNIKSVESIVTSGRHLRTQLSTVAARNGFKYCGSTS